MKREYVTPNAKLIHFDYSNSVVASPVCHWQLIVDPSTGQTISPALTRAVGIGECGWLSPGDA